jgi:DNA-binding transcriptional regulator GbsR (MarR family)
MGSQWGVNRSVSQVHALLYLSDRALTAEDIVDQLGLARSNVSTALKELQSYGIVRRVHVEGDRRDHFVAEDDLWEMLMRIVAERKRREIDPTIALLGELAAKMAREGSAPPHLRDRITRMHEFISTLGGWYEQVKGLPKPTLVTLMNAHIGNSTSTITRSPSSGPVSLRWISMPCTEVHTSVNAISTNTISETRASRRSFRAIARTALIRRLPRARRRYGPARSCSARK